VIRATSAHVRKHYNVSYANDYTFIVTDSEVLFGCLSLSVIRATSAHVRKHYYVSYANDCTFIGTDSEVLVRMSELACDTCD
jgi:hypothetical protein